MNKLCVHTAIVLMGLGSAAAVADAIDNDPPTTGNLPTSPATIDIVPDDGMAGVVGDMVPSNKGAPGEKHFVSPRQSTEIPDGYVILKAIGVTKEDFSSTFEWSGGEAITDEPLKRRVKRDAAGKRVVKLNLKATGQVGAKINVWIVWCDAMVRRVVLAPRIGAGVTTLPPLRVAQDYTLVEQGEAFTAKIQPAAILRDADRPQFDGAPASDPPGTGKIRLNDGKPIARPLHKWDISRQYRCKIITSNFQKNWALNFSTPDSIEGGGIYSRILGPNAISEIVPDYPSDPIEGNDDSDFEITALNGFGENSNPYDEHRSGLASKGVLFDSIKAGHPVALNAPPPIGATIEVRLHFREFCRLEINGKWYRIADYYPWRYDCKLTKDPRDRNSDGTVNPFEVFDAQIHMGTDNDDW